MILFSAVNCLKYSSSRSTGKCIVLISASAANLANIASLAVSVPTGYRTALFLPTKVGLFAIGLPAWLAPLMAKIRLPCLGFVKWYTWFVWWPPESIQVQDIGKTLPDSVRNLCFK